MGELAILVSTKDLNAQRRKLRWSRLSLVASTVVFVIQLASCLALPGVLTASAACAWLICLTTSAKDVSRHTRELNRMEDHYLPKAIARR